MREADDEALASLLSFANTGMCRLHGSQVGMCLVNYASFSLGILYTPLLKAVVALKWRISPVITESNTRYVLSSMRTVSAIGSRGSLRAVFCQMRS